MAFPTLKARLKIRVADGRPEEIRVLCGTRDCGTSPARLVGAPDVFVSLHRHTAEWLAGFRPASDGVVGLSGRARRSWEEARRAGIPWHQFAASGRMCDRQPYMPRQRLDDLSAKGLPYHVRLRTGGHSVLELLERGGRRGEVTLGLVTFACPVCRKKSHVNVPEWWRRSERCPYCQPEVPRADGEYAFDIPA